MNRRTFFSLAALPLIGRVKPKAVEPVLEPRAGPVPQYTVYVVGGAVAAAPCSHCGKEPASPKRDPFCYPCANEMDAEIFQPESN